MTDFEELKEAVKEICHNNAACAKGYHDLLLCENTPQLVECFARYWSDILGTKFNTDAIAFMDKYYTENRDLWRRCGLAYQEGNDKGRCWLIDCEGAVLSGTAKAYVVGACKVVAKDNSEVIMEQADGSEVVLQDYAHCTCRSDATVTATDRTELNISSGKCYIDGNVTAMVGGNVECHAKNWYRIMATGNAVVYAPQTYKIQCFSNARVELTETTE